MIDRVRRSIAERLGVAGLANDVDRLGDDTSRAMAEMSSRLDEFGEQLSGLSRRYDEHLARLEIHRRIGMATTWAAQTPLRHQPLVSVVMATRDRTSLVADAIESVMAQTYPTWELVVVDDGSTDGTARLLDDVAAREKRVRVRQSSGIGPAGARNLALAATTGLWVTFLDDDNLMAPGWLRAVVEYSGRNEDASALFGVGLREDIDNADDVPWVLFTPDVDLRQLEEANSIDLGVLAVRRDHRELRFDETLSQLEDWDLVVRLARSATLRALPVVASIYTTRAPNRVSGGATEASIAAMRRRFGR